MSPYLNLLIGSSDNLEDSHEDPKTPPSPEKQIQHRANTTMHVCWHRNTSVSMRDHSIAIEVRTHDSLLVVVVSLFSAFFSLYINFFIQNVTIYKITERKKNWGNQKIIQII